MTRVFVAVTCVMAATILAIPAIINSPLGFVEASAVCANGEFGGVCNQAGEKEYQIIKFPDGSVKNILLSGLPSQAVKEALELCVAQSVEGEECDRLVDAIWSRSVRIGLAASGTAFVNDVIEQRRSMERQLHNARIQLVAALRENFALRRELAKSGTSIAGDKFRTGVNSSSPENFTKTARAEEQTLENTHVHIRDGFSPSRNTRILKIPVREAVNLTIAEFHAKYVDTGTPVILRGLREFTGFESPESVLRHCSLNGVRLKRAANAGSPWAGLENVDGETDTKEFFKNLRNSNVYLHDQPLKKICPEMLARFQVPAYFASDIMQRVPSSTSSYWSSFRDYWPSIFVSGANTGSGLHADWCSSSAWMAVTYGQKHWRIVPQRMRNLLEESTTQRGVFQQSLFAENEAELPFVDIYDAIVGPGEVIFIPSGAPHQVQNLGVTVALAMNTVLPGELAAFSQELANQAAASAHSTHVQLLPVLEKLQHLVQSNVIPPVIGLPQNGLNTVSFWDFKNPST
mmetsp:Transcript_7126/g.14305  ORF Transcript_7126/g.14305 Transcript_7126/m.14305 type:complete len:517 (+) Transcript_7126:124-1674(+)|eukprot:CAMPEP_0171509852 /NCGR_PEP_ID=MMETSP0959-20130129/33_1 /TAXON_ID=87120 /ORGANISM="Aurantiochytrium limacinum, Strain ATCCMYA-1381" /LENGTH=516 /DNA_ID=CAMNT_0012047141 /DNA_START=36 /DNA_END=1587 /DNA_ORIENTATION=+